VSDTNIKRVYTKCGTNIFQTRSFQFCLYVTNSNLLLQS